MPRLGDLWESYQGAIYAGMFCIACIWYSAFPVRNKGMVLILWAAVLSGLFVVALLVFGPDRPVKLTTWELASVLLLYSVALYAGLCDLLRFALARYLTKKRGYKWVKELGLPLSNLRLNRCVRIVK